MSKLPHLWAVKLGQNLPSPGFQPKLPLHGPQLPLFLKMHAPPFTLTENLHARKPHALFRQGKLHTAQLERAHFALYSSWHKQLNSGNSSQCSTPRVLTHPCFSCGAYFSPHVSGGGDKNTIKDLWEEPGALSSPRKPPEAPLSPSCCGNHG